MRTLDLELLHALVTVADQGSLSATAPLLCRSQSAVSEQIRKLEDFCVLLKEQSMGILEELAGAAAAVVATKKLDPDASLITEGIAAFAGYKGVKTIEEQVEKSEETKAKESNQADPQT